MYRGYSVDCKMAIDTVKSDKNEIECPRCQLQVERHSQYCPHCSLEIGMENTSGTGFSAQVPVEIKGLNWGAFFIPVIWGIFHRVWLGVLCLAPVVGFILPFVLLVKGNDWAWQSKRWDGVEEFKRTQKKWMFWGIAAFLAPFVLILGIGLVILGLLGYYGYIG